MEHVKQPSLLVCVVVMVILGVLVRASKATSLEPNMQTLQINREDELDQNTWKMLLRAQLRQELLELDNTERLIMSKIEDLNEERNKIKAQKRGHTQCFLNLVSCYRKRK